MIAFATRLGADTVAAHHSDILWARAVIDASTDGERRITLERTERRLLEVVAADSLNGAALNDLAVISLTQANLGTGVVGLMVALDYIERSWRIDSTSVVTLYNRALILERLAIVGEAEAVWKTFALQNRDAGWAAEANRHINKLAGLPIFQSDYQVTKSGPALDSAALHGQLEKDAQALREGILNENVPAWARAVVQGNSASALQELQRTKRTALSLANQLGDSSMLLVVSDCDEKCSIPIARGIVDFSTAFNRYRKGDRAGLRQAFAASARALRSSGAIHAAQWADVMTSAFEIDTAQYRSAEQRLQIVRRKALESRSTALAARATWAIALSMVRDGRLSESEVEYARAAAAFDEIRERTNSNNMRAQLANVRTLLGQQQVAFEAQHGVLLSLRESRNFALRHSLLLAMGQELRDADLPNAALAILREAVRYAHQTGRPRDVAESFAWLGRAQVAVGLNKYADSSLATGVRSLESLQDLSSKAEFTAEISMTRVDIETEIHPDNALRWLDSATHYYEVIRRPLNLGPLLAKRAQLQLRIGDTALAQQDLLRSVQLIDADLRASGATHAPVSDHVRNNAYRALIAIALARHDTANAFDLSNQLRGDPPRTVLAAKGLSGSNAVLAFTELEDELLVWRVTYERPQLIRVPMTQRRLQQVVARFENVIRSGDDSISIAKLGRELFSLLTFDQQHLPDNAELVIITQGLLDQLPFSVLGDNAGRPTVKLWTIRFASRLGSLRSIDSPKTLDKIVLVESSDFRKDLFPDLLPLPGAVREVRALTELYPRARVLRGAHAQKSEFIATASGASMLHFAGHARTISSVPERSHLVLAASPGGFDENLVYANEINNWKFLAAPLVVLSSCGTLQPYAIARGRTQSIAQSLLSAGASAVVSSLWEADDDGTAQLMMEFHRRIRDGQAVDLALRGAQLAVMGMQGSASAPRVWGAFRVDQ